MDIFSEMLLISNTIFIYDHCSTASACYGAFYDTINRFNDAIDSIVTCNILELQLDQLMRVHIEHATAPFMLFQYTVTQYLIYFHPDICAVIICEFIFYQRHLVTLKITDPAL